MKNYNSQSESYWYSSYRSKITSVIINNGVTNIGRHSFHNCSNLTSITIPDSATVIGGDAFTGCIYLSSITIPDSVTSIGVYAFRSNPYLTSITYTGTIAQWNAIYFGNEWNFNTGNYTIHCTDGDITKDGTITYHNT